MRIARALHPHCSLPVQPASQVGREVIVVNPFLHRKKRGLISLKLVQDRITDQWLTELGLELSLLGSKLRAMNGGKRWLIIDCLAGNGHPLFMVQAGRAQRSQVQEVDLGGTGHSSSC